MRDIAAPESIRALWHFPACIVMVAQSMISATVTWSHVGSSLCSWESLLGEGSVILNDQIPLLSHWIVHQSFNSLCVDLRFPPLGSLGVVCLMICWNVNLIYASLTLMIYRMLMSMIYCNLQSGKLKNFYLWMICHEVNVVCGVIDGCSLYRWSVSVVSCSCGGCNYPNDVTLSSLCVNCGNSSCNVCKNKIVIWINFACPCLYGGALNLIWHSNF